MPAVNPRITITLTPEIHAILKRLSALTGNSQSAMVGELLQTSMSVFERMVKVLEAAERLRVEGMQAQDQIRDSLQIAQDRLEDQLQITFERVTDSVNPLLQEAEYIPRRSGRIGGRQRQRAAADSASKALVTPVPVTRGSGTPPKRSATGRKETGKGVGRG